MDGKRRKERYIIRPYSFTSYPATLSKALKTLHANVRLNAFKCILRTLGNKGKQMEISSIFRKQNESKKKKKKVKRKREGEHKKSVFLT